MTTSSIVLALVLILAASAFAIYVVAQLKGDGFDLARRQPPLSHHPDPFDASTGPHRLA